MYREVYSLAHKWANICCALNLPHEEAIREDTRGDDCARCLRMVLRKWLQKSYNHQKYGPLTWRMLVKVVGDPPGGNDKSHKKVCQTQTSTCRDEILKNQPNKTGTTPQYFYTIPTSCAILPKLCVCICFLVVCRRGLSCRWKGVAWVCCWWLLLSVAGMVQVVCRRCGVSEEW